MPTTNPSNSSRLNLGNRLTMPRPEDCWKFSFIVTPSSLLPYSTSSSIPPPSFRDRERIFHYGVSQSRSSSLIMVGVSPDLQVWDTSTKEANRNTLNPVPTFSRRRLTKVVRSEAVRQLQRRIRLVDGIINIGFRKECDYSMKMYLPSITNHHIPRLQSRNITLLRRNVKKTVTNINTDLKETTVDWVMSLVTMD